MTRPAPCPSMRDALLVAEPRELRGEGESALAVHLRSCDGCARAAGRILAATGALDEWLGVAPAPPALSDLVRTDVGEPGRARLPRRRRLPWVAVAAAAAAAALLLLPSRRLPPPVAPPGARGSEPLPLLQDAGGRSVAVFETGNPDITLVWFF